MNAFDVIIIGFGKGGKTLAAEFAKRGQKVAVVERRRRIILKVKSGKLNFWS